MKLGIFVGSRNETSSFSEAMSRSLAFGLTKIGIDVSLIYDAPQTKIIAEKLFEGFLPEPVNVVTHECKLVEADLRDYDWIIWNSIRESHFSFLQYIRQHPGHPKIAKLFPRLLGSDYKENRELLRSRLLNFDLVALCLKSDFERAISSGLKSENFAYVPRGFVSELLAYTSAKAFNSKVSVDGLVRPLGIPSNEWNPRSCLSALEKALNRVVTEFPTTEIVTTRLPLEVPNLKKLSHVSMEFFYKEFFIGTSVYVSPPFSKSRHGHFLGDGYRGSYENQIIEAQLAGAITLSEQHNIAQELLYGNHHVSNLNYEDEESIFLAITQAMEVSTSQRASMQKETFAVHDSVKATEVLIANLRRLS